MSMCFWMMAMIGLHVLRASVMRNQNKANNTKILQNQPDFQDPPEDPELEFGPHAKPWASESFCMLNNIKYMILLN